MTAIVIDTSAIFAILLLEPEAMAVAKAIEASTQRYISTATLFEAFSVARRPNLKSYRDKLRSLLDQLDLTVIAFDQAHLELAEVAYARFGRGSGNAASLNMGDCFSYSLAKALDVPLLYKGDDFPHTDLESAIRQI